MALVGAGSILLDWFRQGTDAGPQQLVYHTDHTAVLQACQDVLRDPRAAGFPAAQDGVFTIDGSQGGGRLPAKFPAALANLNFEFMNIEKNQATIYFGGGFGHWGFSTAPPVGGTSAQLVPGLWYWSEEGGSLPRDPAKFPYYRTGEWIILGGIVAAGISIYLAILRRRKKRVLREL
jgi:hypothetical protein